MKDFKVTKQTELFGNLKESEKFLINNEVLRECIGVGSRSKNKKRYVGFNMQKQLGYLLLTYFVNQALGFRRLPFFEDRIYKEVLTDPITGVIKTKLDDFNVKKFCDLSVDELKSSSDEMASLYNHTQMHLKKMGITHVYLRREIKGSGKAKDEKGYAENIVRLKLSSDLLSIKNIQFEMDTLNSFSDENSSNESVGAYGDSKGLTINLKIAIEDVMYCSHLIANEGGVNSVWPTVERGEWVIVNRSPTGVVSMPASSIKKADGMWVDENKNNVEYAEFFMSRYEPIVLRFRNRELFYLGLTDIKLTLKNKIIKTIIKINEKLLKALLKPTELTTKKVVEEKQ